MASITKRVTKSGAVSWRIQIRRQGCPPIHRKAQTIAEAQEIARRLESDLNQGLRMAGRDMTVAALVDRFMQSRGSSLAQLMRTGAAADAGSAATAPAGRGVERSRATCLRHLVRLLGPRSLRTLGVIDVVEMVAIRQQEHKKKWLVEEDLRTQRGEPRRRGELIPAGETPDSARAFGAG